jgi:RecQ family ATP-dependent DNA helicase
MAPPAPSTPKRNLRELLTSVFGFPRFRAHQEQVCEALVRGENALLVMPTGAGKSLCYQLPGIARGGTTLVVSPLIALMDDQVNKLCEVGLRAAAIHSGKSREHSRQACIDYLNGQLDFLFIAPERLALTRFADFLARKRPTLIAIDEAHCISHWGHDFRPDYRLLQRRLPQLMPTPIVALTATATARVQDDIIEQLGVANVRRFVFGFRRDNLAIEVAELPPNDRPRLVEQLLSQPNSKPAIIYAPTRKDAERQAEALAALGAKAYHAGMDIAERERVSRAFIDGHVDVIVATVAFGMGIDKPDVRTVIHTALPSSIEGYYQEIGRAGRDGKPSRAILLHSHADLRTHEWFMERDYPPSEQLSRVYQALSSDAASREQLQPKTQLDPETFDRALEKLVTHGGAERVGYGEFARGALSWRRTYEAQMNHKQAQLLAMRAFSEEPTCHMLKLIRHFGDQEDSGELCGQCDICAPSAAQSVRFEQASDQEREVARSVLHSLRESNGQGVGKLFRDIGEGYVQRKRFDEVLAGLRRNGYIELHEDEFEKDGKVIRFMRASLTLDGSKHRGPLPELKLAATQGSSSVAPKRAARRSTPKPAQVDVVLDRAGKQLVERLKEWRRRQAAENQAPAYTVLTDRAILGIASARPTTLSELLKVHGVGPSVLDKYGRQVLELITDLN